MTTRYDGVTFCNDECLKMSKEEFIEHHVKVFWKNRKSATRRKMLAEVYDLMSQASENNK